MINEVTLIGRVGGDPELMTTKSGKTLAKFSVATDEKYNGEKKTTWHRVTTFDKLADIVGDYVTKGSLVYVNGRITTNEYVDKNNQKRTDFGIIANQVRNLSPKDVTEPTTMTVTEPQISDEDIPF